jgi:TM2 domain-containing membrane protein YozV
MKESARRFLDDPRRKSPALATIMSVMPGLGQIYVGYYQQGFTNILVVAGTITLLANSGRWGVNSIEPLLGVFLAFYWLYNLVDAGRRASFYNQALAGVENKALPEDLRLPSGGGTLAGGIALIALGLIIFSNTMFGFSLEWLEKWWPLGLVLAGGYLIYSAIQDRKSRAEAVPGSAESDVA